MKQKKPSKYVILHNDQEVFGTAVNQNWYICCLRYCMFANNLLKKASLPGNKLEIRRRKMTIEA
jgi:hypothetical protein